MDEDLQHIFLNRNSFEGMLYTCKSRKYSPANPSGNEGRYSGNGTSAYYCADSPEACWREIQGYNPDASFLDYQIWAVQVSGTFVDVGAVEGTEYVKPKEHGGWEPTQELSNWLHDETVLGFRYASRMAIELKQSGTCFCIYEKCMELAESDFIPLEWKPGNLNPNNRIEPTWNGSGT
jgi:hypothetical protein